jgi:hypothetical protein
MALIHKKQKPSVPVLSKDALLQIKHEALQESEKKLASLAESQAALLQQKAALEADHHNALIAHGLEQNQDLAGADGNSLESYESRIVQVQREIAAIEAARGYQQAMHAEITRELSALREEISRQKYREYITELECRVKARKEELIAHLYAGCGLLADFVKLADEAYAADDRATLSGDALMSNAGRRFVQEALEDLNLRTTPIIMIERAGFAPMRSSLAFAQRAYEVRALIPPK